jgi:hypothetical protein
MRIINGLSQWSVGPNYAYNTELRPATDEKS